MAFAADHDDIPWLRALARLINGLAAIPNALICEYCVEPSEISRNLLTSPIRMVDGKAQIPEGPGLGVELNTDVVDRFLWRG